jgi:AcrR family transcriptional regulator
MRPRKTRQLKSFGHNSSMSPHKSHSAPISKRSAETLESLEALILAEGFSRLSVAEIAARLSCSKRALYELAPSKKKLVLLALENFFSRIRQEADRINDSTLDPEHLIYEYLQVGEHASERLSQAVVTDIDEWEPTRTLWRNHIRLRVDGMREIIDNGVKAGFFRDVHPVFLAEVVFASINRLREPDFIDSTGLTISQAFHELYLMLMHSLMHSRANSGLPAIQP